MSFICHKNLHYNDLTLWLRHTSSNGESHGTVTFLARNIHKWSKWNHAIKKIYSPTKSVAVLHWKWEMFQFFHARMTLFRILNTAIEPTKFRQNVRFQPSYYVCICFRARRIELRRQISNPAKNFGSFCACAVNHVRCRPRFNLVSVIPCIII